MKKEESFEDYQFEQLRKFQRSQYDQFLEFQKAQRDNYQAGRFFYSPESTLTTPHKPNNPETYPTLHHFPAEIPLNCQKKEAKPVKRSANVHSIDQDHFLDLLSNFINDRKLIGGSSFPLLSHNNSICSNRSGYSSNNSTNGISSPFLPCPPQNRHKTPLDSSDISDPTNPNPNSDDNSVNSLVDFLTSLLNAQNRSRDSIDNPIGSSQKGKEEVKLIAKNGKEMNNGNFAGENDQKKGGEGSQSKVQQHNYSSPSPPNKPSNIKIEIIPKPTPTSNYGAQPSPNSLKRVPAPKHFTSPSSSSSPSAFSSSSSREPKTEGASSKASSSQSKEMENYKRMEELHQHMICISGELEKMESAERMSEMEARKQRSKMELTLGTILVQLDELEIGDLLKPSRKELIRKVNALLDSLDSILPPLHHFPIPPSPPSLSSSPSSSHSLSSSSPADHRQPSSDNSFISPSSPSISHESEMNDVPPTSSDPPLSLQNIAGDDNIENSTAIIISHPDTDDQTNTEDNSYIPQPSPSLLNTTATTTTATAADNIDDNNGNDDSNVDVNDDVHDGDEDNSGEEMKSNIDINESNKNKGNDLHETHISDCISSQLVESLPSSSSPSIVAYDQREREESNIIDIINPSSSEC